VLRRSLGICVKAVSLAVIVQGFVVVTGSGPVAGATTMGAVCSISATVVTATHRVERGCRFKAISRAADRRVVHHDCTIEGTDRDDILRGTGGKDVICGMQGDDVIKAAGGQDTVYGGSGKDRIRGGPGRDALYGEDGNDRLRGGADSDDLQGQKGNDRLFGGDWIDFISGGYGDDFMSGGSGQDFVFDTFGSDVAMLGPGRDSFDSSRGVDVVNAGRGDDFCLNVKDGRPGDMIDGGPGEDHFDADATDSWSAVEIGPEICNAC
jgi:Ca2+-binding RTX toxin-like protein